MAGSTAESHWTSFFPPVLNQSCPSSRARPLSRLWKARTSSWKNRGRKNLQNETSFLRLSSPVPKASSDEDHFPIWISHMTPHHVYSKPLWESFLTLIRETGKSSKSGISHRFVWFCFFFSVNEVEATFPVLRSEQRWSLVASTRSSAKIDGNDIYWTE